MDWYLKVLRQYMDFDGRARRKEFWIFTLFNLAMVIVLTIVERILGMTLYLKYWGGLTSLYLLFVMLPTIAVSVRRLHDTGRSGWWYLLNIIPLGSLVLLVFLYPGR